MQAVGWAVVDAVVVTEVSVLAADVATQVPVRSRNGTAFITSYGSRPSKFHDSPTEAAR
jgi:hypothetical protein